MKISILNESFLTEEYLAKLRELGDVEVILGTNTEEEAIERLRGVDIAVMDCFEAPMNERVFDSAKGVKLISINSTGYDKVDIEAAAGNGIKIAHVPGFSTEAVAEHAIGLMFAVAKNIVIGDRDAHKKHFSVDPANPEHNKYRAIQLRGKTLGVIGLGAIGTQVAELGKGLGMKVIAYNRSPKSAVGVEMRELDDVLAYSDFISVNLAYVPELKDLINLVKILKMKDRAVLVNTARADIVNSADLAEAIKSGKIFGAGTDVLNDPNDPLYGLENVVVTPHSAFYTDEAIRKMADIIVDNVKCFIEGNPKNIVN